MTDEEIAARCPTTVRIDPVLGLMKRCGRCHEWWMMSCYSPMPSKQPTGVHSWCKACINENRNTYRRKMVPA